MSIASSRLDVIDEVEAVSSSVQSGISRVLRVKKSLLTPTGITLAVAALGSMLIAKRLFSRSTTPVQQSPAPTHSLWRVIFTELVISLIVPTLKATASKFLAEKLSGLFTFNR